jgi:uncharacterized protein (DUF1697 family)
MAAMALVAFLRGVNVGGHRTFRPSVLANDLAEFDVVNVGAAGTFVVRRPGSRPKFRTALLERLPFDTEVALCEGRDLIHIQAQDPFRNEPAAPDIVRFLTVLTMPGAVNAPLPASFPPDGDWLVRVIACDRQFAVGMYRRHPKTIRFLSQVDKLFDVPTTTRNWNTLTAIVKILKAD